MKVIDLTYKIKNGMPYFEGDPVPTITQLKNLNADGYSVKELRIGTHTGTHVDAPRHFIADGRAIDHLDPLAYSGFVTVIDASEKKQIDEETVSKVNSETVFFYTGSNLNWDSKKIFDTYSYITGSAAKMLVEKNVRIVGIDSPSVEDAGNKEFIAHKMLLGNNVLIIENLDSQKLRELVGKIFYFMAIPLAIEDGDGSPARVLAWM